MNNADLTGQRFGMLTVEGDSKRRKGRCVLWQCRCDCGQTAYFIRRELLGGQAESCGCVSRTPASKRQAEDLTGRRFGRLTVERRAPRRKGAPRPLWHCRCDCGNELDVPASSLVRGLTRSCGCLNREVSRKMHDHMHYRDDTCIEMLERSQKNWAENKAGFRGLFLTKEGKYRASITFRKAHYTLGYYNTFDDAVQARLNAEKTLHAGYIEAFQRYEQRAQADPQWAEQNPFYYDVFRAGSEFRISTNG